MMAKSRDKRESQHPMVAVALCFVVGVWLGDLLGLSLYVGGVALLLTMVLYLTTHRHEALLLICLSSGLFYGVIRTSTSGDLPYERTIMRVHIDSPKVATVEGFKWANSDVWQPTDRRVVVSGELAAELWGESVLLEGEVWRMGRRDYLSLDRSAILDRDLNRSGVARVSDWFRARVSQMGLREDAEGVVNAMLLGRRESLSEGIMQSYRESGAVHILAVSGLHVGIFAMMLMVLLSPLSLVWRGNLWRGALVVVCVWLYAWVVGMTPSVWRAAFMFSAFQIAIMSGRSYRSLTVLAGVVLVLVLWDVGVIYDVGFQLSIVAVCAILLWVMPLWRWLRLGLWGEIFVLPLLIGLGCSVAMMPLLASTFGFVSICGVVLNTMLTLTVSLILFSSAVWCGIGFGAVAPLFRWVIEFSVWLQMVGVEWASTGWRGAVDFEIGGVTALLIYLIYGVVTYALSRKKI